MEELSDDRENLSEVVQDTFTEVMVRINLDILPEDGFCEIRDRTMFVCSMNVVHVMVVASFVNDLVPFRREFNFDFKVLTASLLSCKFFNLLISPFWFWLKFKNLTNTQVT